MLRDMRRSGMNTSPHSTELLPVALAPITCQSSAIVSSDSGIRQNASEMVPSSSSIEMRSRSQCAWWQPLLNGQCPRPRIR
jgi:hypothetical protein